MVHYIRFLKVPQLKCDGKNSHVVKVLVTVTNDLGDDFFPSDLQLQAKLSNNADEEDAVDQYQVISSWKAGMRVLWIELDASRVRNLMSPRLHVKSVGHVAGALDAGPSSVALCDIISCRTDIVDSSKAGKAMAQAVRLLTLLPGNNLSVFEDIGDSIARHIWDAGIAFIAFLAKYHHTSDIEPPVPLAHVLRAKGELKVLELGSGCGVVGIAFAQLFPKCDVLLTDLPEAMDILDINIRHATPALQSRLTRTVLNWEEPLSKAAQKTDIDLILVSDCTYNCDSIPDLIKTISALAGGSPNVLVLISLKKRHPSEAVFYDSVDAASFTEVYHTFVPLPDRSRASCGESLENIDIHGYRYRRRTAEDPICGVLAATDS